jgi:hypothetical protein
LERKGGKLCFFGVFLRRHSTILIYTGEIK